MPTVTPQRVAPPVVTQRPIQVPQRSAPITRPSLPSSTVTRQSFPPRSSLVPSTPTIPRNPPPSHPSFPGGITQGRSAPSVTTPQFRDPDHRSPVVRERPTFTSPPGATSPTIVGERLRDLSRSTSSPQFRPLDRTPTYGSTGRFGGSYASSATQSHQWRFQDTSRFSHIDHHTAYQCYPRSHYRVNYCNGYRGWGWYYGPPNVSYYYQYPGVTYYSSRSLIPSTYVSLIYSPYNSLDYQVQRSLYELGYYNGPLDGDIGPMSRMAIANFQADNGLEPTGLIDETLLYYLGIHY